MGGTPSTRCEFTSGPMPLDVDVSRLSLEAGTADAFSQHLGSLTGTQTGDRLQRLERSLLRLEQTHLDTLELLKKLVAAVRRPPEGKAP